MGEQVDSAVKSVGIVSLIATMSNGSASLLVMIIGFSEFLAFQPMINLKYTKALKTFFKGISGLNY